MSTPETGGFVDLHYSDKPPILLVGVTVQTTQELPGITSAVTEAEIDNAHRLVQEALASPNVPPAEAA